MGLVFILPQMTGIAVPGCRTFTRIEKTSIGSKGIFGVVGMDGMNL